MGEKEIYQLAEVQEQLDKDIDQVVTDKDKDDKVSFSPSRSSSVGRNTLTPS